MSGDSATGEASCDLAVFIGRFQPFHRGHLSIVRAALEQADHLLVVIGSEGLARRPDLSPFTAEERAAMIRAVLSPAENARVTLKPVPDFGDIDLWARAVDALADQAAAELGLGPQARTSLVGCSKDHSSYYLDAFPQWRSIAVPVFGDALSATDIRRAYFDPDAGAWDAYLADRAADELPEAVVSWLAAFRATPDFAELQAEWAFVLKYREAWRAAPYPPIFVTADAVVVKDGHVLLIQRKGRPGRGLWALPGGFVEQDERVADAAVRELTEETGLQVEAEVLRARAAEPRVYDAPLRDMRGRTITHAALFDLDGLSPGLPAAEAADDAAAVRWAPVADLKRDEMFGDHYIIIHTLLARRAQARAGASE